MVWEGTWGMILAMGPGPTWKHKVRLEPSNPCRQGVFKVPHIHLLRTLIGDVCVLEDMTVHLPVIEIRIVECRGGA